MNIPLNKFIALKDFQPKWVKFFGRPIIQKIVPTEYVITGFGEVLLPIIARAYFTRMHLFEKKILSYEGLIEECANRQQEFKGSSHFEELLLVEVWEDWGVDGHIEMRHTGYRFVPEKTFHKQCEAADLETAIRPKSLGSLPNCMCHSDDEWAFDPKLLLEDQRAQ